MLKIELTEDELQFLLNLINSATGKLAMAPAILGLILKLTAAAGQPVKLDQAVLDAIVATHADALRPALASLDAEPNERLRLREALLRGPA